MGCTAWKIAFLIQLLAFLISTVKLIDARHQKNHAERLLTKTIDICGELWIGHETLADIDLYEKIKGVQ